MITFERVWKDGCGHPQDAYIGTTGGRRDPHDVYMYMDGESAHLCFRYGDEPSEYISPGSLRGVASRIAANPDHEYRHDFRVIQHHLAKEVAERCYNRGRGEDDQLFLMIGAFADLFAIDPRD